MYARQTKELSHRDRLISRPEVEALPTPLDPAHPHPPGFPDPKIVPPQGQADPDGTKPRPADIDRSA